MGKRHGVRDISVWVRETFRRHRRWLFIPLNIIIISIIIKVAFGCERPFVYVDDAVEPSSMSTMQC
jgi:hypothetical protein